MSRKANYCYVIACDGKYLDTRDEFTSNILYARFMEYDEALEVLECDLLEDIDWIGNLYGVDLRKAKIETYSLMKVQ